MGMWVSVDVAFGINLGTGIPDILYITEDPDQEWEDNDGDIANFLSAWLTSKGENFNFPFDILTYCSYESDRAKYFLAYKPSIQSGGSSDPIFFNTSGIDVETVKKLLEETGFTDNLNPAWAVVSMYG